MQGLRDLTADIARRGHVPVTLGGEHSISYGAVMGVVDALGPSGLFMSTPMQIFVTPIRDTIFPCQCHAFAGG